MEKVGKSGVILKWSRRIRWSLMLAVVAYLGVCLYFWAIQRSKMYEPSNVLQTNPARLGLQYEQLSIPSGSGTERGPIFIWWIPAEKTGGATLLYLHGNDRNMGSARDLEKIGRLHSLGYDLMMVDYRGYGKSAGGSPSEARMYEDAEAAWDYLIKQRARTAQRTFIYGHSLGGAIAIDLAVHHPEAAGLMVESTFTTMSDMGKLEYPWLPVDLLVNQYFDSLDKVSRLKIPVLFMHGTWDRKVPWQMSQRLYDQSPQPKFLKFIEGGEHSNISSMGWLEYRDTLSTFVQKHIR